MILRLATVLFLALVGAGFSAAVAPWLPVLLLGGTYVIGHLVLRDDPARTILGVGLGFIGLITIPLGALTHGVLTGGDGPYRAHRSTAPESLTTDLQARMAIDSVDALGGTLVSYAATPSAPPVLALRRPGGTIGWASVLPRESGVTGLRQMRPFPLLWRVRIDAYAVGPDTPAWLYVWRWGGVQKLYLLRDGAPE